ncbi:MAG: hypothetical protein IT330_07800 [Anaerolineae bacterium]|nr:hypothetical protein [Anaerolineae bacterium]
MAVTHVGLLEQSRVRGRESLLRAWGIPLGAAAFWMLLIWAVHRNSPRTLVSFHGFIHSAIAGQFLGSRPIAFPPENPFFAGQPLPYYWFFQFLAAQITRLLGWNIFYSLEAIILLGTGILMVVAVGLGRRLFRSDLAGILLGYLVVAGTNPFGFLFAIREVVRHGRQVLNDDPNYLWGVVHPLYSLIRYQDFGGLYGPLLNFFLNVTARPVSLAGLLVLIFCLEWALRDGKPRAWAAVAVASALTTAFSPIVGIAAGGALLAGLAGYWLWERLASGGPRATLSIRGTKPIIVAGLAIVIGILVASPTYYHLFLNPSDSEMSLGLFSRAGMRHLITSALSLSLLGLLAWLGFVRALGERRRFLGMLLVAAALLLASDAVIVMPSANQSNFFHAAVVLLAVPAAGSILRRMPGGEYATASPRRAVAIAAVFLPTVAVLLAAYWNRPPLPADFAHPRLARLPQDSDLALLYRWAQDETATDAVFVLDPRSRIAMAGNIAEFPALTGRTLFTAESGHYMVVASSEAKMRAEIAVRLISGEPIDSSEQRYLASLARPVYLVVYKPEGDSWLGRMQTLYGSPVFQKGDVSVFAWRTS